MLTPREITLSNWLEPPFNRRAFQRVREIVPTARISNRTGKTRQFDQVLRPLDDLTYVDSTGGTQRWGDHLEQNHCDAVVVIHDGVVVFERYFNTMTEETPHLLMSVTKSFCGAALGQAIGRGLLHASDLVTDLAPEFAGSSLDGATVQHVIDMTAGTDFVEDYALYNDPHLDSPLLQYEREAGYRPSSTPPRGVLEAFNGFGTAYPHGERFEYRSPLTNVAARIVELVNDMPFTELLSRDLWGPLGQEHEASVMLDPRGFPVMEGGMSCSARDLARFGMTYLNNGEVDGAPIIPASWVEDTHTGNDAASVAFHASKTEVGIEDWSMYRNAFWVLDRSTTYTGIGIFGQFCWVDRPSSTVIALMSSYPEAESGADATIDGLTAVCAHLGETHT